MTSSARYATLARPVWPAVGISRNNLWRRCPAEPILCGGVPSSARITQGKGGFIVKSSYLGNLGGGSVTGANIGVGRHQWRRDSDRSSEQASPSSPHAAQTRAG